MKFKMQIFIIIVLVFILNCDMGLSSGEDLVGEWRVVSDIYGVILYGGGSLTYNADYTGYLTHEEISYFKWKIRKGENYNILQRINNLTNIVAHEEEYFFSSDKQYLYKRDYEPDKIIKQTWVKYKRQ